MNTGFFLNRILNIVSQNLIPTLLLFTPEFFLPDDRLIFGLNEKKISTGVLFQVFQYCTFQIAPFQDILQAFVMYLLLILNPEKVVGEIYLIIPFSLWIKLMSRHDVILRIGPKCCEQIPTGKCHFLGQCLTQLIIACYEGRD